MTFRKDRVGGIASDDRWYPPELHPSNAGAATLTSLGQPAGPAAAPPRQPGERTRSQQLRNAGLVAGGALLLSLALGLGFGEIVDRLEDDQRESCRRAEQQLTATLDQSGLGYWPSSGTVEEFDWSNEPRLPDASIRVDHVGSPEAPTGYTLTGVDECEGFL